MRRVVIVGNSAAGLAAAEAFRGRESQSELVLIDAEACPAYSRVATPYFVKGALANESALFIRGDSFYRDLGITTVFGRWVVGIDMGRRVLHLAGGGSEPFDLLLIATGAFPERKPIEGLDAGDLHVLRTLADARRLKSVKLAARRGLFIGAGLVSLQSIEAMYRPGDEYTLVMKSRSVLSQALDPAAALMVERRLLRAGVRIVKGEDVVRVETTPAGKVATLESGERIDADFLFMGKGVAPSIDWLRSSGVHVDKGVVVDSRMQTNIPGIYAAGDAAQTPDFYSDRRISVGLWPAAIDQGRVAGTNMAGASVSYEGSLKKNVSRIAGLPFASIGDIASDRVVETAILSDAAGEIYRKFCLDRDGILIGAILVNQLQDMGVVHGLISSRRDATCLRSHLGHLNFGVVRKDLDRQSVEKAPAPRIVQ